MVFSHSGKHVAVGRASASVKVVDKTWQANMLSTHSVGFTIPRLLVASCTLCWTMGPIRMPV